MRSPVYLDVAVPDVRKACRFYQRALSPETVLDGPSGSVDLWLVAEGAHVLRVVDEAAHAPTQRERDAYRKGSTVRLEIMAEDVDDRVEKLVRAGATVRARLVRGEDGAPRERRDEGDGPTALAHVVDPFGHLWAVVSSDIDDEPW